MDHVQTDANKAKVTNEEHAVVFEIGGANLVDVKPVFSTDSQYLCCVSHDTVQVVSVSSGQCVRQLRGHTGKITGICINPINAYQLLTCSTDQTIIKWDYTDGAQLKRYNLQGCLYGLIPTLREDGSLLVMRQTKNKHTQLRLVSVPTSSSGQVTTKTLLKLKTFIPRLISVGAKGGLIACVHGSEKKAARRSLTVIPLDRDKTERYKREHWLEADLHVTCLCVHPEERCVAIGDRTGKITLWYEVMRETPVKTVLHWHALPVRDLTFTPHGSYLLSGGHECVLVKWQHGTALRDTLPRLGAPITGVVTARDNTLYCTLHGDNVLQVITAQFKVRCVIQGLTCANRHDNYSGARHAHAHVGLLHDPRTSALVTNGKPGHLQFYSLASSKHLYNLDIVQQNYISPENLHKPLVITDVERAAFSDDGVWLATFERRDDGETTPEMRLKLWHFDNTLQNYSLNTVVETPHEQPLSTLAFRPTTTEPAHTRSTTTESDSPMFVSTSGDGKFKLWTLVDDTDIYHTASRWHCESVGFYRDLPANAAAFAEDGSLLAVAFGTVVTLWDPLSNALRTTLQRHDVMDNVTYLEFGRDTCCHCLVAATATKLMRWDLLTTGLAWTHPLQSVALAMETDHNYLAVFMKDNCLKVLSVQRGEVLYSRGRVSSGRVLSAVFLPRLAPLTQTDTHPLSWQATHVLHFINDKQEVLNIAYERDVKRDVTPACVASDVPASLLSHVLTERRTARDVPRTHQAHGTAGSKYLKQLVTTPAHTLPPVTMLCHAFLTHLVIARRTSPREDGDEEDELARAVEEDSDSDMDAEESAGSLGATTAQPLAGELTAEDEKLSRQKDMEKLADSMFAWMQS